MLEVAYFMRKGYRGTLALTCVLDSLYKATCLLLFQDLSLLSLNNKYTKIERQKKFKKMMLVRSSHFVFKFLLIFLTLGNIQASDLKGV